MNVKDLIALLQRETPTLEVVLDSYGVLEPVHNVQRLYACKDEGEGAEVRWLPLEHVKSGERTEGLLLIRATGANC